MYVNRYGLSAYDAELLVGEIAMASYFERAAELTSYPKILANLIISEIFSIKDADSEQIPIQEKYLAKLADMSGNGDINSSVAKKVLREMFEKNCDPEAYVRENSLGQINDEEILRKTAKEAVEENPKMVSDYKGGKEAAFKSLMGRCMQKTEGKGNPVKLTLFLEEELGVK